MLASLLCMYKIYTAVYSHQRKIYTSSWLDGHLITQPGVDPILQRSDVLLIVVVVVYTKLCCI